MTTRPSPEEAATADDATPASVVEVVAVEYSPTGREAVVLIEYTSRRHLSLTWCSAGSRVTDRSPSKEGMVALPRGRARRKTSLGVEILWGFFTHRVEWDVPRGPD